MSQIHNKRSPYSFEAIDKKKTIQTENIQLPYSSQCPHVFVISKESGDSFFRFFFFLVFIMNDVKIKNSKMKTVKKYKKKKQNQNVFSKMPLLWAIQGDFLNINLSLLLIP